MRIITRRQIALSITFLSAILSVLTLPVQTAAPVDPKTVTAIDGGIGPCSVDFTVNDSHGAPVYGAKIQVRIAYGLMNLHKLDLEAGTNAAGKARFTGLPDNPKQGLFFRASENNREGSAFDDPAKTCKAELTIVLVTKSQ
jgi:hypothetical protein